MASQGPNFPTAASTTTVSSTGWTNPTNIEAEDGSSATWSLGTISPSATLIGSSYGFSIPAGATITGIQVDCKIKSTGTGTINTSATQPLPPAQLECLHYPAIAYTSRLWPTSGGSLTRPGEDRPDTWGATADLTAANINATAFEVCLILPDGDRREHRRRGCRPCHGLLHAPQPADATRFQRASHAGVCCRGILGRIQQIQFLPSLYGGIAVRPFRHRRRGAVAGSQGSEPTTYTPAPAAAAWCQQIADGSHGGLSACPIRRRRGGLPNRLRLHTVSRRRRCHASDLHGAADARAPWNSLRAVGPESVPSGSVYTISPQGGAVAGSQAGTSYSTTWAPSGGSVAGSMHARKSARSFGMVKG